MYEELKANTRALYEEVWNQGNLDAVAKYLHPDYVLHDPTAPGGEVRGIDGFKLYVATFRNAFPDMKFTIDNVIAEEDYTATRFTASGTHKGEFMGIAPTGVFGTVTGIAFAKMRDGKLIETYISKDDLGMFQLMGKVPQLFPELAKV